MTVDILIISSIYDFSSDLVAQELEKRNANYFRLNKEELKDYRLTLDIEDRSLEIITGDQSYIVTSAVRSIYFRQPIFLRNTPSSSLTIDEQLERSQWMGFLRSLSIFEQTNWLNPLDATYLAETKVYQLALANEIGFDIPKTLVGNHAERFDQFKNRVIIKSLDTILLREKNDCLFTYSTLTDTSELRDGNTFFAPLTVQDYVTPKIDIRVTIVGKNIIAIKITSEGVGIEEDWRTHERSCLEYSQIKLPDEVENNCFELMRRLNLNFGAIDLINSGERYYFIEINPTGEWGWLVDESRRIDSLIADWLTGE